MNQVRFGRAYGRPKNTSKLKAFREWQRAAVDYSVISGVLYRGVSKGSLPDEVLHLLTSDVIPPITVPTLRWKKYCDRKWKLNVLSGVRPARRSRELWFMDQGTEREWRGWAEEISFYKGKAAEIVEP